MSAYGPRSQPVAEKPGGSVSSIARKRVTRVRRSPGGNEQLNAVEIEEAISQLADQSFDPESFPFAFLEAFGNKETTTKRLRFAARISIRVMHELLRRHESLFPQRVVPIYEGGSEEDSPP